MAIRNICGFETGDTSETRLGALNGTSSIQSTVKRSGTYAFRANPTGTATGFTEIGGIATNGQLRENINLATAWHSFWFRYATKPASDNEEFFVLDFTAAVTGGGNLKFTLRLNSNGTITAYDSSGTTALGTGSTVLSADTWYRIEVNCGSGSSADWAVRINGNAEISGSGAHLGTGNNQRAMLGKVANRNGQTVDFFYDDVVIDDADYPPVGDVVVLKPTGDGTHTSWTGDWNDVKELPSDGDDSYIEKSANVSESAPFANNSESVDVQDSSALSIVTPIRAVKTVLILRRENNAVVLIPRLYSSSTIDEAGSGFDPGSSYVAAGELFTTDPNTSAAWTTSGVDALQVGVRRNQSQTRNARVTAMYAMVLFSPPAGPQELEGTVSESVSAADSQSALLALHGAIAESVNAVDAVSFEQAQQFQGDIAETATATDSQSAVATFSAAVEESLTAQDAQASSLATSAAVAESASAADTLDATAGAVAVVSEQAQAEDTLDAFASLNTALAESASAQDAQSATLSAHASVAESASAQDEQIALTGVTAIISETATAQDSANAQAALNTSLAETATASDEQVAVKHAAVAVSESVAAGDSTAAEIQTEQLEGAVTEQLSAADSISCTVTYAGLVREVAEAVETHFGVSHVSVSVNEAVNALDATGFTTRQVGAVWRFTDERFAGASVVHGEFNGATGGGVLSGPRASGDELL